MFQIKTDEAFRADYRKVKRSHPHIVPELKAAIEELAINGKVSPCYHPHSLENQGGNYNGHINFHLSDGEVDVVVLYLPHKTNPQIRLVRIGTHSDLFQGPLR